MRRRLALLLFMAGVGSAQERMYTTQDVFSAFQKAQVFNKPSWKMYGEADVDRVTFDLQKLLKQQGVKVINPRFTNALETTRFDVSYSNGGAETSYAGEIVTFKSAVDARKAQHLGKYSPRTIVLSSSNFTVVLIPLYEKSDMKSVVADMRRVFPDLK
ncbi:hypothetical protein [Deinococcus sp.]|uniref:hypothetical protein n=1 Tax=Deinococcus sp. TaxID=47478 RepID=UPI003C7E56E8